MKACTASILTIVGHHEEDGEPLYRELLHLIVTDADGNRWIKWQEIGDAYRMPAAEHYAAVDRLQFGLDECGMDAGYFEASPEWNRWHPVYGSAAYERDDQRNMPPSLECPRLHERAEE